MEGIRRTLLLQMLLHQRQQSQSQTVRQTLVTRSVRSFFLSSLQARQMVFPKDKYQGIIPLRVIYQGGGRT